MMPHFHTQEHWYQWIQLYLLLRVRELGLPVMYVYHTSHATRWWSVRLLCCYTAIGSSSQCGSEGGLI